eukprot:scaffold3124_cov390-Prasinococcus_capsulatus_cf.AAC.8
MNLPRLAKQADFRPRMQGPLRDEHNIHLRLFAVGSEGLASERVATSNVGSVPLGVGSQTYAPNPGQPLHMPGLCLRGGTQSPAGSQVELWPTRDARALPVIGCGADCGQRRPNRAGVPGPLPRLPPDSEPQLHHAGSS